MERTATHCTSELALYFTVSGPDFITSAVIVAMVAYLIHRWKN